MVIPLYHVDYNVSSCLKLKICKPVCSTFFSRTKSRTFIKLPLATAVDNSNALPVSF